MDAESSHWARCITLRGRDVAVCNNNDDKVYRLQSKGAGGVSTDRAAFDIRNLKFGSGHNGGHGSILGFFPESYLASGRITTDPTVSYIYCILRLSMLLAPSPHHTYNFIIIHPCMPNARRQTFLMQAALSPQACNTCVKSHIHIISHEQFQISSRDSPGSHSLLDFVSVLCYLFPACLRQPVVVQTHHRPLSVVL